MLSLFPQMLAYSLFGIAILRITAGITFLSLAYFWHGRRVRELSRIEFIVIGKGAWIVYVTILFEVAVGAALVLGYLTQGAAAIGALIALKSFIWGKRYRQFFPLDRVASALLLVICLSLLVSGAGAWAFDLPL